ncbi:thioredoxin family protein [Enterovirga sp.]|jgi:thioredoxin 1|uniref:thioredoxin family protein n=1 Tax=Enterovirga sp. TaxID=2026350 RepID=UPI002628E2A7|nr:thioredoxin family protein [Enterovirga sp.]MDB5593037.1 Thioredoxin family protein [Enterovirga sp.]
MAGLQDATSQDVFNEFRGSAKPLLIDFYTPSCVLCKKIEPMLASVGEDLKDKVNIVKVDAAANLEVAAEYNVRGVPTLLLLRDGAALDRKTGFMTASMLRTWLEPHVG